MKRLGKTTDGVEFVEVDADVSAGPRSGGAETKVYAVVMRAERSAMSVDDWRALGDRLLNSKTEAVAAVGLEQVVNGLEALGANEVDQKYIDCDSGDVDDDAIELVFSYSVWL